MKIEDYIFFLGGGEVWNWGSCGLEIDLNDITMLMEVPIKMGLLGYKYTFIHWVHFCSALLISEWQ